jgi:hypothetical protein
MDIKMRTKVSDIGGLKRICLSMWDSTPDSFPVPNWSYTDSDRAANYARMKRYIDEIIRLIKGFDGKAGEDPVRWGSCFKKLLYECGVSLEVFDDHDMKLLLNGGFCEVTSDFIEQARTFDLSFKLDDMFQSLRNVWIMNCIQVLMGMSIRITPSIFAYSMLYPYTDNFLDTDGVSETQKQGTNDKLEKRLAGETVRSETPLENRLFRLVEMIERQYDRKRYSMVYESLLGIHAAQVRSMRQDSVSPLSWDEIMDISADKGGCSVLADGCLVKGSLSDGEAVFIFCFGLLLQLADDLQDAAEDRRNGHNTIFTAKNGTSVQGLTNRLINYSCRLLDNDRVFAGNNADQMKRIIKDSVILLIMGAAACNSSLYEKAYLNELEKYSPLGFKTMRECYKRINREYSKLKVKLAVKPLEIRMARAFARGILD